MQQVGEHPIHEFRLGPAYGRNYTCLNDARDDWNMNKDFIIIGGFGEGHGRYMSRSTIDYLKLKGSFVIKMYDRVEQQLGMFNETH